MKKRAATVMFQTVIVAFLFLTGLVSGQNVISNGGFADTTGWSVSNLDASTLAEATFGVDDEERPAMGSGPYLYLTGVASDYSNIAVFQKVTVIGGTQYQFSGAFKDLTYGQLNQFWSEIYISVEAPVDGSDYTPLAGSNSNRYLAFNTWTGCGSGVDGTYQDNGCNSPNTGLYTAPGEAGVPVEVYVVIKTGIWCGGPEYSFDVAVDEVSLTPVGGTAINKNDLAKNEQYQLFQNYPNPFNPATTINFSLPGNETVSLAVFDLTGRKIKTLVNETFNAGNHTVTWDGCNDAGQRVPSGVYLYKIQTGNFSMIRKMTLLQ
ncbi:MAG TPA: T9SS type A sorting domain-containing protein [bacterium]|nr:T9SS type A sorting domain-containing protein [bacterium]HPN42713.1 T9SS type A sorting domain-containing protein [bacterium]